MGQFIGCKKGFEGRGFYWGGCTRQSLGRGFLKCSHPVLAIRVMIIEIRQRQKNLAPVNHSLKPDCYIRLLMCKFYMFLFNHFLP